MIDSAKLALVLVQRDNLLLDGVFRDELDHRRRTPPAARAPLPEPSPWLR
jgi:hypothetical protein